jgi:hypothetical protein
MKIFICIVSAQTLQNLIPVYIEKNRYSGFGAAHLVVTDFMKGKSGLLSKNLEELGVQVIEHPVTDGVLFNALLERAQGIAEEIKTRYDRKTEFVFNLTGGTKLLSLGFYQCFRKQFNQELENKTFYYSYTDTENKRIEYLDYPDESIPMENDLTIKHYLDAQGFKVSSVLSDDPHWLQKVTQREVITQWLGANSKKLQGFFKVINALTYSAINNSQMSQNFSSEQIGFGQKALILLAKHKVIKWTQSDPKKIEFCDVDSAKYLNGLWLEEYVYLIALQTSSCEVKCGIGVTFGSTPNEFDLLITHCNKLLVIECKTLRFDKYGDSKEQDVLNKLDLLSKKVGGLFGENILLSLQPLSQTAKDRAKNYRITLQLRGC